MEEIQHTAGQTAPAADVPGLVGPQKEQGEDTSRFSLVIKAIDQNLSSFHKQRWALEAARLHDVVRHTDGAEKEHARQALRDHYEIEHHPETSRAALVQQAWANIQGDEQVVESVNANLASLHKELWALEAAHLREVVDSTAGAEREHAELALRDHYETEHHPETSRAALVRQAMRKHYKNLYGDEPETGHAALVQQALTNHQAQHPA